MDISIEHAVANYFTHWLVAHPYLAWAISHPLASLGCLLVLIFALSGLIRAIGRGFEQIWLLLLKTPFKLLQPILRWLWRSIERIFGHNNPSAEGVESKLMPTAPSERIELILDRLQTLHQEHQELVSELSTLIATTSVKPESDSLSDTQYKNLYAKLLK
jgi:signal transduction histidine kinase